DVSSVVESNLYHNVHSILRELDCKPQAGSACNKGMLRWTLHNRVDKNPSICVPLLRVLIKELEKAARINSKIRIIPLLHTLVYTVLQVRFLSVFIPEDLYRRMYFCLKSLVTLPEPYCAIALNYARQMKMEQNAPGNICSYIKAIKAFLVYFTRLVFLDPSCPASQAETQLPSPEVSFHVWTKEDEIWNELVNFALMVPTDRNSACLDEDDLKRTSVVSTVSTDSGIEGDMPISELSSIMLESQGGPEEQSSSQSFNRRPCVRCPKAGNRMTLMMEAIKGNGGYSLTKEERNLTARILVMGDDRTLGRLAKTLHTIRKREARHLLLTKRVNMEMYYIPVTDQTLSPGVPEDMLALAGYLGSVDRWYDCNINGLGAMILKLAQMVIITLLKSPQYKWEFFSHFLFYRMLYYVILYYINTCRIIIAKAMFTSCMDFQNDSIFSLAVSANIRVLETRTFTVCLDKDPRKTFKNVQSIEVSPCLDPGYSHQPSSKSKYSLGEGGEPLGKYVNKTLTLPINTFCGTEQ
uniref:Phosphoinositide-3-kinase, regulatory subunit 6b n=1 Tax=Sinocyclocheilus rhinocerous TaxID=307959 RepID=A0A673GQ34_9TELE